MDKYAKKNISTEQSSSCEEARLSRPHGYQERPRNFEAPQGQGTQEIDSVSLLRAGFRLPKESRLRRSSEFQVVYKAGDRIQSEFMTVFFVANDAGVHRLGITASRKGIGKAFARNRAKRLLREAFRLNRAEFETLSKSYDWVFNARRRLLNVKMEAALHDLKRVIAEVGKIESLSGAGETKESGKALGTKE
jgi:ribonuclease P protein component